MTSSMIKLFTSITLLGIALPAFAVTEPPDTTATLVTTAVNPKEGGETKKNSLELTTGFLGENLQDPHEHTTWAGGEIDLVGHHKFNQYFQSRMNISVFITTGSYTNQYTDAGKAPNGILINEAVVEADPAKFASLELGVIQTNFLDLPSTFEANGFPSLRGTVQYSSDDFKFSTFAMQSIPTSDTKAVQSTENGVTTGLTSVGMSGTNDPNDTKDFALRAGLVHFTFTNLNASAATDSQYLGNTIVAPGPQAHFAYGFTGNEVALNSKFRISARTKGTLEAAYLKNDLAPSGTNMAYTYSGGVKFMALGVEMGGKIGRFYNESDTLPGSYASLSRSFNDRFGNRFELSLEDKKEKVKGLLIYTEADAIVETPVIADRGILLMALEVGYDIL